MTAVKPRSLWDDDCGQASFSLVGQRHELMDGPGGSIASSGQRGEFHCSVKPRPAVRRSLATPDEIHTAADDQHSQPAQRRDILPEHCPRDQHHQNVT